jgi:hypothetical protein
MFSDALAVRANQGRYEFRPIPQSDETKVSAFRHCSARLAARSPGACGTGRRVSVDPGAWSQSTYADRTHGPLSTAGGSSRA